MTWLRIGEKRLLNLDYVKEILIDGNYIFAVYIDIEIEDVILYENKNKKLVKERFEYLIKGLKNES